MLLPESTCEHKNNFSYEISVEQSLMSSSPTSTVPRTSPRRKRLYRKLKSGASKKLNQLKYMSKRKSKEEKLRGEQTKIKRSFSKKRMAAMKKMKRAVGKASKTVAAANKKLDKMDVVAEGNANRANAKAKRTIDRDTAKMARVASRITKANGASSKAQVDFEAMRDMLKEEEDAELEALANGKRVKRVGKVTNSLKTLRRKMSRASSAVGSKRRAAQKKVAGAVGRASRVAASRRKRATASLRKKASKIKNSGKRAMGAAVRRLSKEASRFAGGIKSLKKGKYSLRARARNKPKNTYVEVDSN